MNDSRTAYYRGLVRWLFAAIVGFVAVVVTATAASAHATLVTATPGSGEVLDDPPSEVTVTFTEPVTLGAGYLRVVDANGERVDTGNVTVDGENASVPLNDNLPDGGYVVSYRVVSADSHPVSGGVAFAVGDAAPPSIDSQGTEIGGSSDDPAISVLYPTVRWLGYTGLALLAGVLLMALIDPALRSTGRARAIGWTGFDLSVAATLLGGLLQGPYAAGRGLGSLLDPALMSATLETTMGQMTALRLMLLGILGVLLWEWFNADRDRRPLTWTAAAAVVAVAVTHAASGHAAGDGMSRLSIPLTTAHLTAVAAWIGGLAVLLAVVLGRRSPLSGPERHAFASRFSTVAVWLVGVVLIGGLGQAWVRVGSWGALFGTSYGRLLVGKSALLVLALGAAMLSRRLVGNRSAAREIAADGDRSATDASAASTLVVPALRRTVLVEAGAGAVALAVAAVLVATPPARDTYAVAQATTVTFDNSYSAQLSLDPARSGTNTLHLYLFDRNNALAAGIEELAVSVENATAQIGPLELNPQKVGQGHFLANGIDLPADGRWTVSITFTEPGFGAVTDEGEIDVG